MSVTLIAAGVKVAGKTLVKKLGTKVVQKGAKQVAKKGTQKLAQEGAKKLGTSAVKKSTSRGATNQFQKAKNLYNEVENTTKIKDNVPAKDEPEKQTDTTTETSHQTSDTQPPQKKSESKWPFYIAMFFAVIKDAVEIWLSPVAPVLTFLPTIIITSILLLSGKKGTMKIVISLLTTLVDFLMPGVNILPMTTIAVFITMKPDKSKKLNINNQQVSKIVKSVKKFIK